MADSKHLPSKRFAERPKDILATTPVYIRPASETEGYIIPAGFRVKRYKAHRAYAGSYTWPTKGGMMGGSSGSCRGATSGNGIGVVPQAFSR